MIEYFVVTTRRPQYELAAVSLPNYDSTSFGLTARSVIASSMACISTKYHGQNMSLWLYSQKHLGKSTGAHNTLIARQTSGNGAIYVYRKWSGTSWLARAESVPATPTIRLSSLSRSVIKKNVWALCSKKCRRVRTFVGMRLVSSDL